MNMQIQSYHYVYGPIASQCDLKITYVNDMIQSSEAILSNALTFSIILSSLLSSSYAI